MGVSGQVLFIVRAIALVLGCPCVDGEYPRSPTPESRLRMSRRNRPRSGRQTGRTRERVALGGHDRRFVVDEQKRDKAVRELLSFVPSMSVAEPRDGLRNPWRSSGPRAA